MKYKLIEQNSQPQKFRQLSPSEQFNDLPWYAKAGQAADDVVRGIANGVTLGYADQLAGYMNGTGADAERAKTEAAKERGGSAMTAAEIVGALLPASSLSKAAGVAGVAGSSFPTRTMSMAGQTALLGAGQRMGTGQEITPGNVAMDAALGAGGNVIGEGISAGVSKVAGLFNKKPPTMTAEQLKAAGRDAYRRAEDAGVIFKPEAIGKLRDQTYADMADFGFHPKNQPGAAVAYDELARLAEGGNVSLKGLDTARKVAAGGFNAANPSNNTLIGKTIGRIDDFAVNAGPDDLLTGDSRAASEALGEARDYWSRSKKLEQIDRALTKGERNAATSGSGGNKDNAIRQQIKAILNNDKKIRGFTPDERAAMEAAARGTPTQNTLRALGAMSPAGNGLGKMLWAGAAGGGAMSGVGLLPMLAGGAVAAGTSAARYAAPKIGEKNVKLIRELIAAGGSKAALAGPKNAVQKLAESKRDALARVLAISLMQGAPGK